MLIVILLFAFPISSESICADLFQTWCQKVSNELCKQNPDFYGLCSKKCNDCNHEKFKKWIKTAHCEDIPPQYCVGSLVTEQLCNSVAVLKCRSSCNDCQAKRFLEIFSKLETNLDSSCEDISDVDYCEKNFLKCGERIFKLICRRTCGCT